MKAFFFSVLLVLGSNEYFGQSSLGRTAKTRAIKGIVKSDNDVLPGIFINEIGHQQNGVFTDVNGEFELLVDWKETVYIQTSGMHFDRYFKYDINENFKKFIFRPRGSKKAERRSRKIYKEWRDLNDQTK